MMGLLYVDIREINITSKSLAIKEARTHFQKDKVFRYWSSMHGGFYVPIDEQTTPSPYLEHIPDPIYFMRSVYDKLNYDGIVIQEDRLKY